jgi:hypothetical protein
VLYWILDDSWVWQVSAETHVVDYEPSGSMWAVETVRMSRWWVLGEESRLVSLQALQLSTPPYERVEVEPGPRELGAMMTMS